MRAREVIVVLGMHRSGTSLLASVLHALGFSLGQDLHPPDIHNPAGYFEDRECMSIQERILETLGLPWHGEKGMLPFPPSWWKEETIRPLVQQLETWLDRRLAEESGRWAFKDPRTTRFLGLWRELFAARNIVPRYVLAIRDPAEVVASEVHRDGVPNRQVYHTWLRYNLEAILYGGPHLAAVVDYARWFDHGEEQMAALASALGIELRPRRGREILATVLRSELHRQVGSNQPTPPPWARKIYESILVLAAGKVQGPLWAGGILAEAEYFDTLLRQDEVPDTEGPLAAIIASPQTVEERIHKAAMLASSGQRVVLSLPTGAAPHGNVPAVAAIEREALWPAVQGSPFAKAAFEAYRWLRQRSYDAVYFPGGQGLATLSLDARRQGWPWRHGPVHIEYLTRPDWLRPGGVLETANFSAAEAACLDRRAVPQADHLLCGDGALLADLRALAADCIAHATHSAASHSLDDIEAGNKGEPPLVSVCITHYNRPDLLRRCLDSVRAQDYSRLEVVLVDDGSDDPAVKPVLDALQSEFQSKGWRLIRQENRYLGAARNAAARAAAGEYLFFLDDDNLLLADAITHVVSVAERSRADIVTSTLYLYSDNPEVIPNDNMPLWVFPGACPLLGIFENCYGDANALMRRACWKTLGGFTEDRNIGHEDWEFFARAVLAGWSLEHNPEPVLCYRVDPKGMARSGDWEQNYIRAMRPYLKVLPTSLWPLPILAGQLQRALLTSQTELQFTKGELQLTAEELQLTAEELQFTKGELQLTAEELQLTTGELQLAKQEKQTLSQSLGVAEAEILRRGEVLSQMLTSRSWRITRPLRDSAVWVRRQRQRLSVLSHTIRRDSSGHEARFHMARALWRHLPLSDGSKMRFKAWLFRRFPTSLNRISRVPMALESISLRANGTIIRSAIEPPAPHTRMVSIIICVHNALEDTKRCIESVLQYTMPPYEIIFVDDGSDVDTRNYLIDIATAFGATLIRHEKARGYTRAANAGLQAAKGDYFLLLNSDTIVTPEWLDRIVACADSDKNIGLVGPLSNTASWQSVPQVIEHGDWAENPLPPDYDTSKMASVIARASARLYPRLPLLNGFCLLVRSSMAEQIGFFDEEHFGAGYGEENDYCLRAKAAGWQLAVADDAYVFHAQSRSYSHERRQILAARADAELRKKYDYDRDVLPAVGKCQQDLIMMGIRARVEAGIARRRLRRQAVSFWEAARVAVLLPVADEGGGGHVIIQECQALREMGVVVKLINLECNREQFQRSYPSNGLDSAFLASPEDIASEVYRSDIPYDLVVATANYCVPWLTPPPNEAPRLIYYVQDFEPDFYPSNSREYHSALQSYTLLPQAKLVTKTQWNAHMLQKQVGVDAAILGPSVDIDLFRPRSHRSGNPRLCAMLRPATPRRAAERTLRILGAVADRLDTAVELHTFGCTTEEFLSLAEKLNVSHTKLHHWGRLTRTQMVELLNECEVFADFSDFQAMGLTTLEAMACGNAVIVPQRGGSIEFVQHGKNGWIVDSAQEGACLDAAIRLLSDTALRHQLSEQALQDAVRYASEGAAYALLEAGLGRDWRNKNKKTGSRH